MSAVPDILKAFNRAKGGEDVDLRFMTLLPAELEVALKQVGRLLSHNKPRIFCVARMAPCPAPCSC